MRELKTGDSSTAMRWGVCATAGIAILIGGFWLVAWLTGYAASLSAAGVLTPKANMALCQILGGMALLLLGTGRPVGARRSLGVFAAIVILLMGALTLSEHLFGWNLGIDQILAREAPGAVMTDSPNRMGPPGSLSFVLLGIGFLALAFGRRVIPRILGLITCLINLVPAVGFLYGIEPFYGTPHLTFIAWPSVVALTSLGIGLTITRSDRGPVALLLGDDPGGALLRRLLPAVILIPLALGFLLVVEEHRGLYDMATGTGLLVIALILIFSAMLWQSAGRLSRSARAERESEETLHSVAQFPEENPNPILRIGHDGEVLYTNAAARELLAQEGWKLGEFPPPALREPVDAALRSGQVGQFDMPPRDGRIFSFDCIPISARNYANLYGRDVTERRNAEEALRESEERYRTLFDSLLEGFCIIEVIFDTRNKPIDYRFLLINPAFENQTGLHDAQGKSMRDLAPEHEEHWFEIYGKVALTGEQTRFVNEAKALNRWYDVAAYRVGGDESRRVAILFSDISETKRAEERLAEHLALLEEQSRILDLAHVLIRDPNDCIITWNTGMELLYGFSKEEALGEVSHDLFKTVFPVSREVAAEELATTGHWQGELVHTAKDGRKITVASHQVLYRDNDGRPVAVLEVNNDVTEQKRAEEALKESEAHEREFYRRTILAATEGKLLISERNEIEKAAGPVLESWALNTRNDFTATVHAIGQLSRDAGMEQSRVYEFLGCCTEAVTNVLKHAETGRASLHRTRDGLTCVVSDAGSGIKAMALPDVALTKGYSTAGTLGMGYKLMLHFADRVSLATGPEGTTVAVEMRMQGKRVADSRWQIAGRREANSR